MRKYILLLVCLLTLPVFSQYVEKDVYEGVTISQDHHMTVCGVSMGLDVHTFENKMKQKGFVVSNNNRDYQSLFGLKGKLFGLPFSFIDIYVPSVDDGKIEKIQIYKKYSNKQAALSSFNLVKNSINKLYPRRAYSERTIIWGTSDKEIVGIWDIFSQDKTKIIGNIEISAELFDSNDLTFCVTISDVPNWQKGTRYTFKSYDLSKYASSRCDAAFFIEYPTYYELILQPKDEFDFVRFNASSKEIVKICNNPKYSDFEKNLFFYLGIDKLEKPLASLDKQYCYEGLDSYIYKASNDYSYEKRRYLAAQQKQQSQGMTSGEAMFEIWEGTANVQKYKKDGTYQARLKNFINTWNAIAGGGSGGGTNWDNLNDAQKAVIHQNDNGR